jgi:hypothetical protein
MAKLSVHDGELSVSLSTWEQIGGFKRDFAVPIAAVTSVEYVPAVRKRARGLRVFGTGFPGKISLGRRRARGHVAFVAAYRDEPGYVIGLRGERYDELIIASPPVDGLDALTV